MRALSRGVVRALAASALVTAACTTPVDRGEQLYREGDRLGALQIWRTIPKDARAYPAVQQRIALVEAEFQRLVVRYKQRARYFESKGRLAESILNDRLALELQPDDAATLARVQQLARTLASRKAELMAKYRAAFSAGNLAEARQQLTALHTLDAFDPVLETEARDLGDALRSEVSKQIAIGRRGFASGNFAAAQKAFEAVLELDPDNESAQGYISYIDTLRQEGSNKPGRASPNLGSRQRFASQTEIRAEGFYQNGLAAARRGDYYAAIRQQLFALGANSSHVGAQQELSRLRRRLAPEVDKLIESGREAFRNEDLQTALDEWRLALLVDPENERTRAYVGHAERQLENLERMRSEPESAAPGGVAQ
jgi:tetratricopeptide (TPR) repeat protein